MGYKIQMITTHIEGDDKGCPLGGQRAVSIKSWNNARLLPGVQSLGRRLTKVEFYIWPLLLVCSASSLGNILSVRQQPSLLKAFSYFVVHPLFSTVRVSQSRNTLCWCCYVTYCRIYFLKIASICLIIEHYII